MGIVQFQIYRFYRYFAYTIIYQSIGVIFQYHCTLHRESHMPIDRTYVFKSDYLPSLSNPLYLGQKPWFLVERFHCSLYKSTLINSLTILPNDSEHLAGLTNWIFTVNITTDIPSVSWSLPLASDPWSLQQRRLAESRSSSQPLKIAQPMGSPNDFNVMLDACLKSPTQKTQRGRSQKSCAESQGLW